MPKFRHEETMLCYVTFVHEVEADDETDAINMVNDGDGELIEEIIGDSYGSTFPSIKITEIVS